jgi:hypothetical protein
MKNALVAHLKISIFFIVGLLNYKQNIVKKEQA